MSLVPRSGPYRRHRLTTLACSSNECTSNEYKPESVGLLKPYMLPLGRALSIEKCSRMLAVDGKEYGLEGDAIAPEDDLS